jgi:hypothetical protein
LAEPGSFVILKGRSDPAALFLLMREQYFVAQELNLEIDLS